MEQTAAITVEVRSSSTLPPRDAFEQWEALMADAIVPSAISPLHQGHWRGKITSAQFDRVSVALMRASAQQVNRSPKMVARSQGEFLLANIVMEGTNWTEQEGRTAESVAGSIAFYDSGFPLLSRTTDNAMSTMLRAPLQPILDYAGLTRDEIPLAIPIPTDGAMGVVTRFFQDMATLTAVEAERASVAFDGQTTGMLASAVLLAVGKESPAPANSLYTRQQMMAYLRNRFTDPDLTVDEIARACLVSRRTLYRMSEGLGGPGALIRRMRIEYAKKRIRSEPTRPLNSIATASGFSSDRHFYRAFQIETGMTPGEFRAQATPRGLIADRR
ncbi:helix-turn-helix transcriptional regulator [Nocardia terrae]|uniref:helix-turn-helix transcriptional regulator n=1 Tax=Nocardia terrae TaxID=2675851 RepID=UPI0018DFEB15|nr:AraC family transcriptional regulator [Nocardia terrae]